MFDVVRQSGFKDSGISIGANGKFIVQVRGCNALEVPLSRGNNLLVSEEYIRFLIETANEKFEKNLASIDKLYKTVKRTLDSIDEAKQENDG